MKRDLRIICAGLNRDIAPGARGLELIAIEFRQVDKCRRPLGRKPVTVRSVLHEKPGAKTEGEGQPSGRQAEGGAAVWSLDGDVLSELAGGLSDMRAAASVQTFNIVASSSRFLARQSNAAK